MESDVSSGGKFKWGQQKCLLYYRGYGRCSKNTCKQHDKLQLVLILSKPPPHLNTNTFELRSWCTALQEVVVYWGVSWEG